MFGGGVLVCLSRCLFMLVSGEGCDGSFMLLLVDVLLLLVGVCWLVLLGVVVCLLLLDGVGVDFLLKLNMFGYFWD